MSFLERQLEDPVRFKRIKRLFYGGLILVALAEVVLPLLFDGAHPHFSFESWPAWGSFYGLISCAAIIIVSKLIGKVWLTKPELPRCPTGLQSGGEGH